MRPPTRRARRPNAPALRLLALAALLLPAPGRPARAQDQIRRFTDPILVLNTGGHHADVKALAFAGPDTLLSAGRDKVVHAWDLAADPPRRTRTIRPLIWRGSAGAIYAMALSPPDPRTGQAVLALAGRGVESLGGTIALYRYPGAADRPTGDLIGYIYCRDPVRQPDGHERIVNAMAFAPNGGPLATGSHDGTVRLWDVAARRARPLVLDHGPNVRIKALAFTADGRRLVTGDDAGAVRVWDVSNPDRAQAVAPLVLNPSPRGPSASISSLAVVGNDLAYVGRDGGVLGRIDLRANAPAEVPVAAGRGAVLALAAGPGDRLAASVTSRAPARDADLPPVECDVEVRAASTGALREAIFAAGPAARYATPFSNSARALAFSPDGRRLAIAGGDRQGITVVDADRPPAAAPPLASLFGTGRAVWRVGFVDRPAEPGVPPARHSVPIVAHAAEHPNPAARARFEGFDLRERRVVPLAPGAAVRGPVPRLVAEGWTAEPVSPYIINVRNGRTGRLWTLRLDPAQDLRWWSYTFLPPSPAAGHADPAIAIACGEGVAVYNLNTGRRTRTFYGHEGAVYAVAPSPDGRWLLTGSADQTVRLWALAGCTDPPPLGADFQRRPNGERVVARVRPRSFAEAIGLKAGDVVASVNVEDPTIPRPADRETLIARDPARADDLFRRIEQVGPGVMVAFKVVRDGGTLPLGFPALLTVGTTRRHGPAASLYVGEDREWVVWLPRGDYDTSIAGDSRHLGWHLNQSSPYDPAPTDFLPIARFERDLRRPKAAQPNVLDRLLETADEVQALALAAPNAPEPAAVVLAGQPPDLVPIVPAGAAAAAAPRDARQQPIAPGEPLPSALVADAGRPLPISFRVRTAGRAPADSFVLRVDGRALAPPAPPPPADERGEAIVEPPPLELEPGWHRLQAETTNRLGITRIEPIDVQVLPPAEPPPAPARPRQLRLAAIAPSFRNPALFPAIPLNEADAAALRPFLARHLVDDQAHRIDDADKADPGRLGLTGDRATGANVAALFDDLARWDARPGDLLVVVVETYVLNLESGPQLIGHDADRLPPSANHAVSGSAVAEALGAVASKGCRVLVLLDGLHRLPDRAPPADIDQWVRDLRDQHGVITFLASKFDASAPAAGSPAAAVGDRRVFAQALLDSILPDARRRRRGIHSLDDVRGAVVDRVRSKTNRQQEAECYIPDRIGGNLPLIDPRAK